MALSWLEDYKVATGSTIKKSKPLRKRLAASTMEDAKTTDGSCAAKKQKTSQKAKQKSKSSIKKKKAVQKSKDD